MIYYKIESDTGDIIGIATSDNLYRCGSRDNTLLANEKTAQFIQCDTKAYHADWMQKYTGGGTVEAATVLQIDADTYSEYLAAIEAGEEILQSIDDEEATTEESSITDDADTGDTDEAEVSQTMPTYEELLKVLTAYSALEKRVTALEGAAE